VYEKSVRRLESLEVDHKRARDEVDRLRRQGPISRNPRLGRKKFG
jgi:hypothetical protein